MTSPWQHLIDKHRASLDAAKGIFTWTSEEELAWLAEEASKRERILEIGTYKGHSAKVMARATKGLIVCFDMCPEDGVQEAAKRNLADEKNVTLVHGDAGATAVHLDWYGHIGLQDMVWIDDGHTYADVVRDCLIALLLGRRWSEEGRRVPFLICGHDYEKSNNDVARAVNDCFGQKNIKFGPGSIWYL